MRENNLPINLQMVPAERLESIEQSISQLTEFVKNFKPQNELPNMLTSEQTMEVLKIGRWKFDQLIADNELKYIRKGRKLYIYEESVREYFGL